MHGSRQFLWFSGTDHGEHERQSNGPDSRSKAANGANLFCACGGSAMVKNILGKSENSTLGVIMVTTTEGQSWKIRAKLLEWRSGANPSGLRSNIFIKLHELFI